MLALIERQNTRSVLDFVHIYQKENVMCFLRNSANKIIKFQPKDFCLKWKPKKNENQNQLNCKLALKLYLFSMKIFAISLE